MAPRSDEPRRDAQSSRRGASRAGDGGDTGGRGTDRTDPADPGSEIGGISDARAYTPRGRTVREAAESAATRRSGGVGAGSRRAPRATRSGDPFRPALQVLDGGRPHQRGTAGDAPRGGVRAAGTGRTVVARTPAAPAPRNRPPRAVGTPARPAARPADGRPARPARPSWPIRYAGCGWAPCSPW
ncbi:hypothetical protein GCM10027605_50800 [Micromonospora zhanjiangensis]